MMLTVTQILKLARQYDDWKRTEEEKKWYFRRGKLVHLGCELFDRGQLDWKTVDTEIAGFVQGWRQFREDYGGQIRPQNIERRVESKRWGYVGHLDVVIENPRGIRARRLLVDRKTGSYMPVSALQTMGYAIAFGEPGIARATVVLSPTGGYRVHYHANRTLDRVAWLACLPLARWRLANGEKLEERTETEE